MNVREEAPPRGKTVAAQAVGNPRGLKPAARSWRGLKPAPGTGWLLPASESEAPQSGIV